MAAFQFPDPAVQTTVKNPITGSTYQWQDPPGKWVMITASPEDKETIDRLENDVDALQTNDVLQDERLTAIEALPVPKDYMIGTDKNLTRNAEPRNAPAIELVDSEGYFSNVKFEATGGLAVTSSASSIIFDGSGIDAGGDVNLDNYYTKAEADATEIHLQGQIDELLVTKGTPAAYTLNDVGIQLGARPGDFYIDNTIAQQITLISLSPEDNNGNARPIGDIGDIIEIVSTSFNSAYRYTITQITEGLAGVSFLSAADPNDLLIPGNTFNIYVYPQNKTTASIDYVDQQDDLKLSKTGGVITGELHFDRGEGGGNMMIYPNVGTNDSAIYALNNSAIRFRTVSGDTSDSGERKTHISISKDPDTLAPVTNIYHLASPTAYNHAANKQYVDDAVAGVASSLSIEDTEPDIHYGDYPPSGNRTNGEIWFDSFNLRLNVYSQGAWINPDRNDGASLENKITALEARLAQLEGN
jgi:hypothetical protein